MRFETSLQIKLCSSSNADRWHRSGRGVKTQSDVAQVRVRPIQPQERKRFERWMEEHPYLRWGQPVGKTLYYVAAVRDRWVGLLAFGAAA